jgi:hypothetical protein
VPAANFKLPLPLHYLCLISVIKSGHSSFFTCRKQTLNLINIVMKEIRFQRPERNFPLHCETHSVKYSNIEGGLWHVTPFIRELIFRRFTGPVVFHLQDRHTVGRAVSAKTSVQYHHESIFRVGTRWAEQDLPKRRYSTIMSPYSG